MARRRVLSTRNGIRRANTPASSELFIEVVTRLAPVINVILTDFSWRVQQVPEERLSLRLHG